MRSKLIYAGCLIVAAGLLSAGCAEVAERVPPAVTNTSDA
jgi:hypothetical protein